MEQITIKTTVNAPLETVWSYWNDPEHVTKWNQASEDWHCPHGENDLRVGGAFSYRMEAKDGSFGFDFGGIYDEVKEHEFIAYHMEDGRKVRVEFNKVGESETEVIEHFDPETENSVEMQRQGWQSILDNFRRYVEENASN